MISCVLTLKQQSSNCIGRLWEGVRSIQPHSTSPQLLQSPFHQFLFNQLQGLSLIEVDLHMDWVKWRYCIRFNDASWLLRSLRLPCSAFLQHDSTSGSRITKLRSNPLRHHRTLNDGRFLTTKVPASALQCISAAWFDLWVPYYQAKVKPTAPPQDVKWRLNCRRTDFNTVDLKRNWSEWG